MTGQLAITRVAISPPRQTDPPELLCHVGIVLCGCFHVRGIRLVRQTGNGRPRILFPLLPGVNSAGLARRRALARPTNPSTRSMIEWAVLRAYRAWLETNAADATHDKVLDRELVS